MKKLSAIIITKNEEHDIEACLKSLNGVADEIILVDDFSTDNTVNIAKRFGAKIFQRKWNGFSEQKQFALSEASGEWVINIDADERLTPALRDEIKILLDQKDTVIPNGFYIPFNVYFLGERLRFSNTQGEKHLRLFRKTSASYGASKVHEGIKVTPPHGTLKNRVEHYSYATISEYLQKCDLYTGLLAQKKRGEGKHFHFYHHLVLPWELLRRYVFKLGFLDGSVGFTYSALSAYYVWLKYLRLKEDR